MRRHLPMVLVLALLAGCRAPIAPVAPGTPKPGKTPAVAATPRPPATVVATLAGKVKLIADAKTGLVGDHGGGLIGDHGGGMISDHGGGIISNNSGAIIANNGGAYRLAQAAGSLGTFALAEAEVTFLDAAGKPLAGADGKPLVATTDQAGAYALDATIPPRNFVARVALKGGGELRALVVPGTGGKLTADLDTASTIGAAYVLDRLVKGDQAVYDRLPRTEADRLTQELTAFPGYLVAAPTYRPEAMAAAAEALAARVPTVGQAIDDVKALLLGQSQLGEGRPGTEVALGSPLSLALDADGTLLIGEGFFGRIRTLAADGTIAMQLDAGAGKIKGNFLRLSDMARAKDGTLWATTESSGLFRVSPAGAIARTAYAADGAKLDLPSSVACAPDGTVYVGEFTYSKGVAPRVLAIAGDAATRVAIDAAWDGGRVAGLAIAPDGALIVAYDDGAASGGVYRWQAGQAKRLAAFGPGERPADVAVGRDGTIYVVQADARRVVSLAADGTVEPVAGAGAPVGDADLQVPNAIATAPDGTLWVSDRASSRVWALSPAGAWAAVAGADGVVTEGATTDFAINQPTGMAFDAQGALYVAEVGSSRVRRFKDGKLETFAGSSAGYGGDGGPATQAKLDSPSGLAFRGDELLIAETLGRRLRAVAKDGTIRTILGVGPGAWAQDRLDPGKPVPAAGQLIPQLTSVAVAAGGTVYLTSTGTHQLFRFAGDTLEAIAGRYRPDEPSIYTPTGYVENAETDPAGVLGFPVGLAVDPTGKPVIAEMVACRVMRVDGTLTRLAGRTMQDMLAIGAELAGTGQTSDPDGVAATASTLVFPTSVAYGPDGSLYVAEGGTIHLAAQGQIGNAGGAIGAFLGVAIDAFAMPKTAGRVRKIAKDGTITTIAGRGTRFFPADAGDDALVLPMGLAVAPDGRLAIADVGANMIRILPAGSY